MFSPSLKKNFEVLWPLLTSAALCLDTRSCLRLQLSQISPGKNANLHPIYPPHLPPCAPDSGRASFCCANSPAQNGLICGFCSSGQGFAAGFLQIPPRGGNPCLWLILLAAKRIADLHRRVSARAGRTHKKSYFLKNRISSQLNPSTLFNFLILQLSPPYHLRLPSDSTVAARNSAITERK